MSICDRDCFHCKYADCILEELEAVDYDEQRRIEREFVFPQNRKQKIAAARQRAYREAHRDAIAARQRAYYEAHRDAIAARQRAYREAHRDAIAAKKRAYREANREKAERLTRREHNGSD